MTVKKNVTEEAMSLGALLRAPYEHLSRRLYSELAERGFPDVRPAYSAVFRTILPDGSRVSEMAERAQMTKQSMAYLVDALAERGYVRLTPDPEDRRAKRVTLTEKGEALVARALEISLEREREVAGLIGGPEAMRTLRDLLTRLAEGLE